ncbi:MAG: serine/threonine protein kinase [Planctomycetaceae bacterium]
MNQAFSGAGSAFDPLGAGAAADSDDPRVLALAEEFVSALDAGLRPSIAEYAQRYPELKERVIDFLEGVEFLGVVGRSFPARSREDNGASVGDQGLQKDPLGDFQILKELGRGGMGIVYEAVQLSLGRRVALKVLPFASTFDARQLQRFKNEAQAAALLHHTHIVPIHAVGCERGVHFYAMQLIEGQSLAVVIRQLREQAGIRPTAADASSSRGMPQGNSPEQPAGEETRRGLPAADRSASYDFQQSTLNVSSALTTGTSPASEGYYRKIARLMVQAAEALEHAHQLGVVHRDVKPANLLVNAKGDLWVTDFGLAQLQAENDLTHTGDVLGTVRYMSPEQTSGQRAVLDHRTDIYSLGATFYELMTLTPLFDGETRQELIYRILHHEPTPPRSLNRAIPRELETIILKALSKMPAERYGTAAELAADLQRYLDDQPIRARRPSLVDRARKWSRRHPSIVIAGMLLLAVIAVALSISNRLIAREREKLALEQDKTARALRDEKLRANDAEIQLRRANQAVEALIQVGERELAVEPMDPDVRLQVVETAFGYYQSFLKHRSGNTSPEPESAVLQERVDRTLREFNVLKEEWKVLQQQLVMTLLWSAAVLDEVGLTADQRERVAILRQGWLDECKVESMALRRGSSDLDARRRRFVQLATKYERLLADSIPTDRVDRLGQIAIQAMVSYTFSGPESLSSLKLPAELRAADSGIEFRIYSGRPDSIGAGGPATAGDQFVESRLDEAILTSIERLTVELRKACGMPFPGFHGLPTREIDGR